MLKFYCKTNDWYKISIYSLCLTVFGGFLLRLQYAGIINFESIDLRRSHSHLGFYGILFPMLWYKLKDLFWIPKGYFIQAYVLLLVAATVGFATAGYGPLAHVASFLTLMIWLTFAFKNIRRVKDLDQSFLNVIPISIILSSIFILLVLFFRSGEAFSPLILVRTFLIILLFGVFAPLSLDKITRNTPLGFLWVLSVMGFGLIMTGFFSGYFMIMPAILGFLIVSSLLRETKVSFDDLNRIRLYWHILAVVLFLISFKIIPNNHFTAVSGIHFFIFLIVIPTFLEFKSSRKKCFYEILALGMVSLIYSQNLYTWSYQLNQVYLSLVSGLLIIALLLGLRIRLVEQEEDLLR